MTATPTMPVATSSMDARRSATRVIPNGAGHPPACRTMIPSCWTRTNRDTAEAAMPSEPTNEIQR